MKRKSKSLLWLALAGFMLLARNAQATTLTAYNVDSSLGGFMSVTPSTPIYDAMTGDATVELTATNTSASVSYQDVGLALEFFYPTTSNTSVTPTGNGFTYDDNGVWMPAAGGTLSTTGVTGAGAYGLEPLSDLIVPLNDTYDGKMATVVGATNVPLIQLGNFGPLQSETFTLDTKEGGPEFYSVSGAYFVAVPEPSSIVLLLFGLVGIVALRGRRPQYS